MCARVRLRYLLWILMSLSSLIEIIECEGEVEEDGRRQAEAARQWWARWQADAARRWGLPWRRKTTTTPSGNITTTLPTTRRKRWYLPRLPVLPWRRTTTTTTTTTPPTTTPTSPTTLGTTRLGRLLPDQQMQYVLEQQNMTTMFFKTSFYKHHLGGFFRIYNTHMMWSPASNSPRYWPYHVRYPVRMSHEFQEFICPTIFQDFGAVCAFRLVEQKYVWKYRFKSFDTWCALLKDNYDFQRTKYKPKNNTYWSPLLDGACPPRYLGDNVLLNYTTIPAEWDSIVPEVPRDPELASNAAYVQRYYHTLPMRSSFWKMNFQEGALPPDYV